MRKISKNALSQALRILMPEIKKPELFGLIGVSASLATSARYWREYNVKCWEERSAEERTAALEKAKELISEFSARTNGA